MLRRKLHKPSGLLPFLPSPIPTEAILEPTHCHWSKTGSRLIEFDADPGLSAGSIDPDELLQWFLTAETEPDLLRCLGAGGRFWLKAPLGWDVTEIREWQAVFHELLGMTGAATPDYIARMSKSFPKFAKQLSETLDITVDVLMTGEPGAILLIARDIFTALLLTVYLNHLQRANFDFCTRPGCGKPFRITSSHKRFYCSPECAKHASVQRLRQRQREAKKVVKEKLRANRGTPGRKRAKR